MEGKEEDKSVKMKKQVFDFKRNKIMKINIFTFFVVFDFHMY